MRGKRFVFMLCAALLLSGVGAGGWHTPVPVQAHERDVDDVSVFDEPLAQHGTWTTVAEHGRVWIPRGVRRGWRPYTDGRWVYSDVGWTWVSDEPWGWAPFHYGRWSHHVSHGWYWVPGTVWGPAWVSWRHNPGWVGWAPLPPRIGFHANIGLGPIDINIDIAPHWFSFVEDRHILAPRVHRYCVPPTRNVQLIQITKNVTNYTVINNRIINRSIDVHHIERVTRRPVVVHRIVDVDSSDKIRGPRVRDKEREVVLVRHPRTREQRDDNDQERRQRRDQDQARDLLNNANQERRQQRDQDQARDLLNNQRRDQDQARDLQERGNEWRKRREQLSQERVELQERQRQERQNRPAGVSDEELRQRHEAEREALKSKARNQRQELGREQALRQGQEERTGIAGERPGHERPEAQQKTVRERQQDPSSVTPEDTERRERRERRERQQALRPAKEEQGAPQSPSPSEQRGGNPRDRSNALTDPGPQGRPARTHELTPEERRERRERQQALRQPREEQGTPQSPPPSEQRGNSPRDRSNALTDPGPQGRPARAQELTPEERRERRQAREEASSKQSQGRGRRQPTDQEQKEHIQDIPPSGSGQ